MTASRKALGALACECPRVVVPREALSALESDLSTLACECPRVAVPREVLSALASDLLERPRLAMPRLALSAIADLASCHPRNSLLPPRVCHASDPSEWLEVSAQRVALSVIASDQLEWPRLALSAPADLS